MPRIFISYRRQDSKDVTGRIHEHLSAAFGEHNVFRDVYDIAPGSDFRAVLNEEVSKCDIFLAIMGPDWASIADAQGNRRLLNPNDFVRIEVESALKRQGTRVIPILVNNASMPKAEELPESMQDIHFRNAFAVRPDPDFPHDMETLISYLKPASRIPFDWRKRIGLLIPAVIALGLIFYLVWGTLGRKSSNAQPTVQAAVTNIAMALSTDSSPTTHSFSLNAAYPVNHSFSIYQDASEDSLIVARAQSGTQVTILEQNSDQLWTKIRLESGQEGWALSAELANNLVLTSATTIAVGAGFGMRTDSWQLYFTAPGQTSNAPAQLGIDARLANAIDKANKTIDIAAFDFDNKIITEAVLEAKQRGVRVRMVKDRVNGIDEEVISQLIQAGIEVIDGGRSNGLMHDAFVVLDDGTVWTGSWTYTENGTYKNNDNALVFTSPEIASAYEAKFEEMFSKHEFGTHSSSSPMNQFTVAKVPVEIYFAPRDNILPRLLELIGGARRSIHFLAFTFTNSDIADTLIAKQNAGIPVQGIIETRGSSQGQFDPMFCGKVDVRTDGNKYSLHHKVIVIDDQIVITGSLNFTSTALTVNDENMVIVHDPVLAKAYNEEFQRLWEVAVKPTNIPCQ